ncbi:MAG TPA: formyltransferase family protein [Bacteriovoracaceae bacterium]|nr:formyltransferase family protein [Bacteriovoracaceae bacterium]
MRKIAIFASGTGSNAINLTQTAQELGQVEVCCLIVDKASSPLPTYFSNHFPQVPVYLITPNPALKGEERRSHHEALILEKLRSHQVDWIFLAGYLRLIGQLLLNNFPGKIVNIHPSLLPAYPGLGGFERTYADKATGGVTIHLVDQGLDTGPIILQRSIARRDCDSLEDFISRGKEAERELYPQVLRMLNNSEKLLHGE